MDRQSAFSGLTQQFALACGLCSFFQLITLSYGYFPLVLLPCAPAIYAANRLFLRQSRTMRGIVLFNAAFFTALFASVLLIEGTSDWGVLSLQGGFCLWVTVWGASRCLEPPDLHSMIVSVDLSVLTLLFFAALSAGAGLPVFWSAPAAAGCAASILGLITQRVNRPLRPKEWGLLLLVFSGLFAVICLLVFLAAAPAGQILMTLWNTLTGAARWLARKLGVLLLFLLPDVKSEEMDFLDPALSLPAEELPAAEASPAVFVVLVAIFAAAATAALILTLHQLGRLRVGGGHNFNKVTAQRRSGRIPLRQALKRLWTALGTRLRLWIFLWRSRNTPEGLFHLLVRRCRLSPWRKRTGETPREFLTRLREVAVEDRELCGALDGLIPAVDAALYAPSPDWRIYPAAKLIRRQFGAAFRRRLFRRGREALERT